MAVTEPLAAPLPSAAEPQLLALLAELATDLPAALARVAQLSAEVETLGEQLHELARTVDTLRVKLRPRR